LIHNPGKNNIRKKSSFVKEDLLQTRKLDFQCKSLIKKKKKKLKKIFFIKCFVEELPNKNYWWEFH